MHGIEQLCMQSAWSALYLSLYGTSDSWEMCNILVGFISFVFVLLPNSCSVFSSAALCPFSRLDTIALSFSLSLLIFAHVHSPISKHNFTSIYKILRKNWSESIFYVSEMKLSISFLNSAFRRSNSETKGRKREGERPTKMYTVIGIWQHRISILAEQVHALLDCSLALSIHCMYITCMQMILSNFRGIIKLALITFVMYRSTH